MGIGSILEPLVAIGCFTVVLFMAVFFGPLGLVGAVVFGAVAWGVWRVSSSSSASTVPERINCAACGARNDVNEETCDYCGEPL